MTMPDVTFELAHGRATHQLVAGVDEVGRGPLAGPVIACAVILPADLSLIPAGITDSKKLTAKKRAAYAPLLRQHCIWALGEASVAEIDEINILQATFLAMRRAIEGLPEYPHHALIDGPHVPRQLRCTTTPIIEGDSKSLSIAAASIIAKVARDTLMQQLDQEYPGYGWNSNAGYGAAVHMAALQMLGITPHHRRSFAPIARLAIETI